MTRRHTGHHRVTQVDVARVAGVSQTVVSMVLRGTDLRAHRVGTETRQRVLDAISATGYAANPVAQSLAGGRTSIIGVHTYEPVFPHGASDFYHPFLEGVEIEAQRSGVDLLLFTSTSARTDPGRLQRLRVADGCVLLGLHSRKEDLRELVAGGFPFAFVGRRDMRGGVVPYAGADYESATTEVVSELIAGGHRRIALVTEIAGHESAEDRTRGYRTAMRSAGLAPVVLARKTIDPGRLLAELAAQDVSAVVSPDLAQTLHTAAVERGWDVPGRLSIARLGDPPAGDHDGRDWTGFTIPRLAMGSEALRIVLRQLSGETGEQDLQVLIPCAVRRGTTTAPYEGQA